VGGYAWGVIRRGLILFGLLAFALFTTGAAETLHRLLEHGPAPACESLAGGGSTQCDGFDTGSAPGEPERPRPDHDDDDCTVCLTLGASRDAADEPKPYVYGESMAAARSDTAPAARAAALAVYIAGPARAPPFSV